MKRFVLATLFTLVASVANAGGVDFSGRWNFDAAQSQNIGMMAQATVVSTITQTATTLSVADHSVFGGRSMDDHTAYDLTGAPAQNLSKMTGAGTTHSRWNGNRLVTEWDSAGAVPGSTVTRIETRYLSQDGRTMFIESSRPGKATIVMAFDRAQ